MNEDQLFKRKKRKQITNWTLIFFLQRIFHGNPFTHLSRKKHPIPLHHSISISNIFHPIDKIPNEIIPNNFTHPPYYKSLFFFYTNLYQFLSYPYFFLIRFSSQIPKLSSSTSLSVDNCPLPPLTTSTSFARRTGTVSLLARWAPPETSFWKSCACIRARA